MYQSAAHQEFKWERPDSGHAFCGIWMQETDRAAAGANKYLEN